MKKVYAVMWDNGETYPEDNEHGVWCICTTFERANEVMKQLGDKITKDVADIRELELENTNEGQDKINAIESYYFGKMYYYHLEAVEFYVQEYNLIE